MAKLTVQSGADRGTSVTLGPEPLTVGRSVANGLQIVDKRMSRSHAQVFQKDGRFFLRDLQSKNGTQLNGAPLADPAPLRNGDIVQVGDTILLFEEEPLGSTTSYNNFPGSVDASSTSMLPTLGGTRSSYRVVDENQWGAARGEVRAGANPATAVAIDTSHGAALRDASKRLEILYQVSEAIRSLLSLDEMLQRIVTIIQDILTPDRTYILLADPETGALEPRVIRVADEGDREVKVSSSIIERCMSEGVSLLVSDATIDQRFAASESVIINRIRTAMVAPIIYQAETFGVVYVDTRARRLPYTQDELELLTGITNQAATGIINARLHSQLLEQHKLAREMEIARAIQMNLLPKMYPPLTGYDISAMSLPAKHVGGDYYDFLELGEGRVGFAIADVSGKGVPAAILTATTRSYLQSETAHPDLTLPAVVARINRMVHRDVTDELYVTMALAALDPETGAVEWVNAGHAHPILLRPDSELEYLDKGGLFLGISAEAAYESGRTRLDPGAVLLLTTDGVTDIHNSRGETFGTERLISLLRDVAHRSAEDIRNAIYQSCVRHRGDHDQFDDFTLIVLKRDPIEMTDLDDLELD